MHPHGLSVENFFFLSAVHVLNKKSAIFTISFRNFFSEQEEAHHARRNHTMPQGL